MSKTVHVFPAGTVWKVAREGGKPTVYPTKKKAVGEARSISKRFAPSQLVIHGKDGHIQEVVSHGLPSIKRPPYLKKNSRIQRIVGKLTLSRLASERRADRA